MDQKIRVSDSYLPKISESSSITENHQSSNGEEVNASDHEFHPDVNSEFSDAATLEQRRAYKIELQVDIISHRGRQFLYSCQQILMWLPI